MLVMLLIAAACAILLWPAPPAGISNPFAVPASPKRGPDYMEAVAALQTVRTRLVQTGALDAEQQKAVDALTLALVSGSDK